MSAPVMKINSMTVKEFIMWVYYKHSAGVVQWQNISFPS